VSLIGPDTFVRPTHSAFIPGVYLVREVVAVPQPNPYPCNVCGNAEVGLLFYDYPKPLIAVAWCANHWAPVDDPPSEALKQLMEKRKARGDAWRRLKETVR
jgi:hypothetical protein